MSFARASAPTGNRLAGSQHGMLSPVQKTWSEVRKTPAAANFWIAAAVTGLIRLAATMMASAGSSTVRAGSRKPYPLSCSTAPCRSTVAVTAVAPRANCAWITRSMPASSDSGAGGGGGGGGGRLAVADGEPPPPPHAARPRARARPKNGARSAPPRCGERRDKAVFR